MPSRKQRRRRVKDRRHYEWVYVDEEGREVEAPEEEPQPARKNDVKGARAQAARGRPPARRVPPPSWRRVGKRALIFAPLMFVTLSLIATELTLLGRVVQTVVMLGFFLPFSYFVDSLMYRSYLRRGGQPAPEEPPARRSRGARAGS